VASQSKGIGRWVGAAGVIGLLAVAFVIGLNLKGCDEKAGDQVQAVRIDGKTFFLEVVDEPQKRFRGLGGRTHIDDNGGMLFVFPRPIGTNNGGFVMRDCPIPIDIIFIDASGRVINWHHMAPEPPRGPDEGEPGTFDNQKYEDRLKRYPAEFPYQFAVELKGGTLEKLHLRKGEKLDLPVDALKQRAR
jgi:uncharacterized membrane protein (UPF0127 family)